MSSPDRIHRHFYVASLRQRLIISTAEDDAWEYDLEWRREAVQTGDEVLQDRVELDKIFDELRVYKLGVGTQFINFFWRALGADKVHAGKEKIPNERRRRWDAPPK